MKNKYVGYLVIGIAAIIGFIVYLFNNTMKEVVAETCSHGQTCPMYGTIATQTWLSLSLAVLVGIVGLALIFQGEERVGKTRKKVDYSDLKKDEEKIMKIIEKNEGSMFQSKLVEDTNFNKVKVSRLLDKLEGKDLIERKRRGMSNMVIRK